MTTRPDLTLLTPAGTDPGHDHGIHHGIPGSTADALTAAAGHCRAMLAALGIDTDRDGVRETPARFVRALDELTRGRHLDPDRHLAVTFPAEGGGEILVERIPFTAVCEHHLLVFDGHAAVAYLPAPGARIVGLSKLARLVQEYAARPQVQERLTRQVVDAIEHRLDTVGVACMISSEHSCMSRRGARAHGSWTRTGEYRGIYRTDAATRTEFLLKVLTGQPADTPATR